MKERKEKFFNFAKKSQLWVLVFLILAVILGVYIRSLPMQDHGGRPGLWDTTNDWTLGPDLDPWLFTRYAEHIIEDGEIPAIDYMRNVPLGFDTSIESKLLPYLIVWTYNISNLFGDYSVEFAAAFLPVIMFAFTIISFFIFVREVFIKKSKKAKTRANLIAIISSFFMIVIPVFLSRTVAGIPEKESAAFFFLFLSLYFFLKSWKAKTLKSSIMWGVLAGISTGMMGLVWGGVIYIFITVALSTLLAFILNKTNTRILVSYFLWIFISSSIRLMYSTRISLRDMMVSLDTGLAFFVFFLMLVHFILWKTKISQMKRLNQIKLPKTIITLIIAVILIIILASIAFGPLFIFDKIKAIHQAAFKPVIGRWNTTVAENRQPYYTEWIGNFGPFLRNIPILFWMFFLGSAVLFKRLLKPIKNKDAWVLTLLYSLFFMGMTFSRYSGSHLFNGENLISQLAYYGSALLFLGYLLYYYIKYSKAGDNSFEKVDYCLLLLFSLSILALFTARGAVRLVMVLGPIAPIFAAALIVDSWIAFRRAKDETFKIILGIFFIIILLLSLFTFTTFYRGIKGQAYNFVPSAYNQQWQKAMEWVRDETPQNAVFSHWWDYGYWVQSIGKRATVLDGGNAISFWNYYMGRLVLTGDNQEDALEFLYNHNATHFLIDSTDIGKYGAYSSIGSNENYDRFSWFGTFGLDEQRIQETKNQTLLFYSGGVTLDEDLIIEQDGKEVYLPAKRAGVGAVIIPTSNDNGSINIMQPYAIMVYNGKQYKTDMRYVYVNGELLDFETGIEACARVVPSISTPGGQVRMNNMGAMLFISPRLFRGMFSQVYLLDDALNKYPNFKLAHVQENMIVENLQAQGMAAPSFVFYGGGIQGPIKIWEISYTGNEELREDYIDRDPTKYLSWRL